MKCVSVFFIAVIVASLFPSEADAATITWSNGYPQPGSAAGKLNVKGTFTPDTGGELIGCAAVIWKVGSGPIETVDIPFNASTGVWDGTISGLTPDQEYNVIIHCTQRAGAVTKIFTSDPKKAKAASFTVRLLILAGVALGAFPALVCVAGISLWLHASGRCVLPRCAAAWR